MPIDPFWESEDSVPDEFKEHTKPGKVGDKDVVFLDLTPKEGFALEDVLGLKKSLQAANHKATGHEKELKAIRDQIGDADLSAALTALGENDTLKESLANAKPEDQVQALVASKDAEWRTKFDRDMATFKAKESALTAQVRDLLIDRAATDAILQASGNPRWLLHQVTGQMKLSDGPDGTLTAQVVDSTGAPRVSEKPGDAGPMGLDELLTIMRRDPDNAEAFAGTKKGGTGADADAGGGAGGTGSGTQPRTVSDSYTLEGLASGSEIRVK